MGNEAPSRESKKTNSEKKPGMRRGRVPKRQRTKVEKGEERSQVRKGVTVSSCCPSVS